MGSWAEDEIAECDLGDARLNRRLSTMLEALGERPGKSLPTAFQDWAFRQHEIKGLAVPINRAVEVGSDPFNIYVSFVHPPRICRSPLPGLSVRGD